MKCLPLFAALVAVLPASVSFAQTPPAKPAKLTATQSKQLAQAQATMNQFLAAARKGDTKKAKTFCTPDVNFEDLLDLQNSARLKKWANALPKNAFQNAAFHTYEEEKITVITFGISYGKRKGGMSMEYDPKVGKLTSMDGDAD